MQNNNSTKKILTSIICWTQALGKWGWGKWFLLLKAHENHEINPLTYNHWYKVAATIDRAEADCFSTISTQVFFHNNKKILFGPMVTQHNGWMYFSPSLKVTNSGQWDMWQSGLCSFQVKSLKGGYALPCPFPLPSLPEGWKGTWAIWNHVDKHKSPIGGRTTGEKEPASMLGCYRTEVAHLR